MIKRFFRKLIRTIKQKFDLTALVSTLALVISLFTMYYQFFNVKHELLYTFLFPSVNEKLEIPLVYKNSGNQNEMILESNMEMEIIPEDGSAHYFKRIGDENKKLFPLIIAPGEYKHITLLGDYKDYFKGMLEQNQSGLKYRSILNLDTLSVIVTTKFIMGNGISEVKRHIGKISFKKDKTFQRMDINPIKLTELKGDENVEMTGGTLVNNDRTMQITSMDSLTSDQIEQIKFLIATTEDTSMRREMIKFLRRKNIDYQ